MALVLILIIISQPFITSNVFSNQLIVNLFAIFGYLLIAYPLYLIYKLLNANIESTVQIIKESGFESQEELKRINKSIRNDFIFYKHFEDAPFSFVSDSVSDILGVKPSEFRVNYKKYKAGDLYEKVFDRIKTTTTNGIRVPLYEHELKNKEGVVIKFEVIESPIFDEANNIIGVWGTLHHISHHENTMDLRINDDGSKYDLLINNINDAPEITAFIPQNNNICGL